MRKLTQAQENFARLYVELGNAAEAYRQAYPKSQKWQDQSVWVKASALANSDKVSVRVSELRHLAAEKTQITLESHLKELERLRIMAEEQGNVNAAIQAEVARGKHSGVVAATKVDVKQPPVFNLILSTDAEE
jgi:phage terminase small subunit